MTSITRRLSTAVVFVLCGVGGYVLLVDGTPSMASWRDIGAVAWFLVWVGAALLVGLLARRRAQSRPRAPATGAGNADASGPREHHRCPDCGAQLSLRRSRRGPRRGQPSWQCPEHGPIA